MVGHDFPAARRLGPDFRECELTRKRGVLPCSIEGPTLQDKGRAPHDTHFRVEDPYFVDRQITTLECGQLLLALKAFPTRGGEDKIRVTNATQRSDITIPVGLNVLTQPLLNPFFSAWSSHVRRPSCEV